MSRLQLQTGDLLDAGLEAPDELLVEAGVVHVEDVRQGGVNNLAEGVFSSIVARSVDRQ